MGTRLAIRSHDSAIHDVAEVSGEVETGLSLSGADTAARLRTRTSAAAEDWNRGVPEIIFGEALRRVVGGPATESGIELVTPFHSGYNSQMKRATITETKNQLSAVLDSVRNGETVLILDRGRPIARMK